MEIQQPTPDEIALYLKIYNTAIINNYRENRGNLLAQANVFGDPKELMIIHDKVQLWLCGLSGLTYETKSSNYKLHDLP